MQPTKIITLAAWSLLFSFVVFGQDRSSPSGRLAFDIAEAVDNLPLHRVFVYVHNGYTNDPSEPDGRQDTIVKMDNKGRAEIVLRPGLYDIFISNAGFSPKCRVIEVLPDQTTPVIERMVVDEEHQQQ